ncbi:glyceraldehyde-3-phosphate dehydrogenase [Sphingobacterium alkalisoli]|uniref:Glyceraldehyde-3-phosphate dehydrogenase n=1 Tax=Sphingobacterium alkalisoli TaxID=1874115 RepID=A0A4U0H5C2_9SPHI|nr:glyceraldehyde-3-phosphate dehydrogenase [Sphingobacterium alkalisoli]TJY66943.1 glyceraldehyde-3-phosphate dehydrogenase [Sphingobacterium alkalisoli]GGH13240.1 glyceraldehyde-3-phosphate dehydrogenase [Sphingobacterium alkalisoli]
MSTNAVLEQEIKTYTTKQNAATKLVAMVSNLWYNHAVELVLFRNQLVDRRVSHILNVHSISQELTGQSISVFDSVKIVKVLMELHLCPARIDIGKLILRLREKSVEDTDIVHFLIGELQLAKPHNSFVPRDVVLYGFGRIGRLLARELIAKAGAGKQLRLRAIVTRDNIDVKTLEKRAALLRNDSIHGRFDGQVEVDVSRNALIVNGITVHVISAQEPEHIDYYAYGIQDALLIDNTGAFRDEKQLSRHLISGGIAQVLLTAPGKGIPNVVFGVNEQSVTMDSHRIVSAASCTTNAIAPILQLIESELKIIKGHVETIHSYTNDQNLVDNMHRKARRGRAAAVNMVITETGAGTAVAKAIPSLAGKLTSNAIRVPVPNGSLAILNLEIVNKTSIEQLKSLLQNAALHGNLVEQINYSNNDELVSSDCIGTTFSSIVDAPATIVSSDGKNIVLYIWYDNEYGYTHQVMRLARHIAGVRRYTYY